MADKEDTKTTTCKKDAIIASLRMGSFITAACKAASIDRGIYYDWLSADKKFAKRVESAKISRVSKVEDALFNTAIEGNTTAGIFFLCNRDRANWRSVQHIVHGGDIEVTHTTTDLLNAMREQQHKNG